MESSPKYQALRFVLGIISLYKNGSLEYICNLVFGIWNNYISNQRILDLYLMVYVLKEMETASLNITH